MPLREFKCKLGHVTERLLTRAEYDVCNSIRCPKCAICPRGLAYRVDVSRTGTPVLKEGIGGFERPSRD